MRRRLSRKRGGDGGLNRHIENYVKELNNENRENKLQEHKQLYLNAYARHNNVKSHVKSGFMSMNKKPNPVIEQSFNKRVENEKIRLEEEIVARNLKKDKQKRIQHGVARKTMGLSKERKQGEKDKLALMRARAEAIKMGSRVIPSHMMPSSPASRYVDMKKASDTRGPSKLRGGKRRTRKRRSRKNKKSRKHKRNKKGRGIGPFGKQKPLSSDNKPKRGDKVRVKGQAGWTVITPMNRAAIVCPPGNTSSNQCSFGEQEIRYNEMTKMGFMGQMGLKKTGGKKRKSRKAKKGGYAPCNMHSTPDSYCIEKALTGDVENNENTKCDMDTGECVKPSSSPLHVSQLSLEERIRARRERRISHGGKRKAKKSRKAGR